MTRSTDLQTRFCQYTGIPLDRLHWNHTGWCYHPVVFQWQSRRGSHVHRDAIGTKLADASTQWCPSGNPVLICIIGTHWKTTGATSTLECHWNHTAWCYHPVMSQWQSSVTLHNWNTLEDHWKATGRTLETYWLPAILSPVAIQCWGLNFRHTRWPLDCHWITTGNVQSSRR